MEALIIAAGRGSRMTGRDIPKPLVPVRGTRLLELVILSAKASGIEDFKVVVGFQAERIAREIGPGGDLGVRIEYVFNPAWTSGNGLSVAAARGRMKGRFLLLMADHLFDPAALAGLTALDLPADACALGVDYKLQGAHFDPEDVTRVFVEDGLVRRIGKGLIPYNGLDTGLFSCSPAIFEALEQSLALGGDALTDANRILSEAGRLRAFDIGDRYWMDIDDPEMLRKAEEVLPGLFDPRPAEERRSDK